MRQIWIGISNTMVLGLWSLIEGVSHLSESKYIWAAIFFLYAGLKLTQAINLVTYAKELEKQTRF